MKTIKPMISINEKHKKKLIRLKNESGVNYLRAKNVSLELFSLSEVSLWHDTRIKIK